MQRMAAVRGERCTRQHSREEKKSEKFVTSHFFPSFSLLLFFCCIACILRTHKFLRHGIPNGRRWRERERTRKRNKRARPTAHTIDLNIIACDSFSLFFTSRRFRLSRHIPPHFCCISFHISLKVREHTRAFRPRAQLHLGMAIYATRRW